MECLPSFFDDLRTGKKPARYPGDISRERYQSNAYADRLMRDVVAVEIAAPAADIRMAESLFVAAGFDIRRTPNSLEASDGTTTVILDAVPQVQAGWRRIVFSLNRPSLDAHVEHIGRSVLVVGPGNHAVWSFSAPNR